MQYELMFADQIRTAIEENWPVVLPVGVLEYHGEHCVVGVDTLLVVRAVQMLEQDHKLVILPPYYYGAASYVVAEAARNGSVQIDPDGMLPFARQLFHSLLKIGFRNMHLFVHHQSENFVAGMPTDLSFKLAARQVTFEYLTAERGDGWWGDNSMADYYDGHETGDNPFNWIQVHPFMSAEIQKQFPIDHAGLQETSLMMAFCPEGVDMNRLSKQAWYCQQADQASMDYGERARTQILEHMKSCMGLCG